MTPETNVRSKKIQQLKNLRSLTSIRHQAQAGVRQRQYEHRLSTKCMSRYFVFTLNFKFS